ncbi:PAS domain-containing sensor histidine kinase [Candidatus Hydrogenosomobacter endosymbioticus]|uniref:histidine kinase n=2 Tax=Candidatus Hydrogenosomobacter endosymbioticus TaxID=2558174 RepID=A0ABN6L7G0_9PROT|nr:PAS domain-containing sensor histidine kinase [Candidatus Hydrogenosomobacter endosymbioticus]
MKHNLLGAQFQLRVTWIFCVFSIAPSIIVAISAVLFLQSAMQTWFHSQVQTALLESQNVAKAYIFEHQKVIEHNVRNMAQVLDKIFNDIIIADKDLFKNQTKYQFFRQHENIITHCLTEQAFLRSIDEAIIFTFDDGHKEVVASSRYSFALSFRPVCAAHIEKSISDGIFFELDESSDRAFSIVPIFYPFNAYLFVSKYVDQTVLQRVARADESVSKYTELLKNRGMFALQITVVFALLTILLVLLALVAGVRFSKQLISPIGDLIDAAESFRTGNICTVRADPKLQVSGIKTLINAFNTMVEETSMQKKELIGVNEKLRLRNDFIEKALSGITSGVMSLYSDGKIALSNKRAAELLLRKRTIDGSFIKEVADEFFPVFIRALENPNKLQEQQLPLDHLGRVFRVHAISDAKTREVVITFDEIGELISAQRKSAWADVARRIAHEIKNPLTPIMLSAERLKRKYIGSVQDKDVFQKCIDTITKQVTYIGKLISEFSSFSRMPIPSFSEHNLHDIIQQSVFMQQQQHQDINFVYTSNCKDMCIMCDAQQLAQAFTNILKNAAEAIEERLASSDLETASGIIRIHASETNGSILVKISDNGIGLAPEKSLSRFFEPYFTTKASGTGLGLSIVKKTIEDHGGDIFFSGNGNRTGACVCLTLRKRIQ